MDYLLRDSYHIGVPYGLVDKDRLIRSLRILDIPLNDNNDSIPLGINEKDLPLVESLLMSRHWMYSQVYQHPTRKIYDEHLQDFLKELMQEENFKVNKDKPEEYLQCTDSDILKELFMIQDNPEHRLYNHANLLLKREKRFRLVYKQTISDKRISVKHWQKTKNKDAVEKKLNAPTPTNLIYSKIPKEYLEGIIQNTGKSTDKKGNLDFPVKLEDGSIKKATNCSNVFKNVISTDFDYGYIFAEPRINKKVKKWIIKNRAKIIRSKI